MNLLSARVPNQLYQGVERTYSENGITWISTSDRIRYYPYSATSYTGLLMQNGKLVGYN